MKFIYIVFALLFWVSCNPQVPADYMASRSKPDIYPDYKDVTIPINMAPLTFEMNVEADISREEMQEQVENDDTVKSLLEGKNVVKVIAIPGKLVNFVVR